MENVDQHYVWGLSGPTLVLYVVAVALFMGILTANRRVIGALTEGAKARRPGPAAAFTALITLASNFIGVATIALLAKTSGASPRLSMVALPLVLLVERHLRAMRGAARTRGVHAAALVGGAAGLLGGAWALLRSTSAAEQVKRAVVSGEVRTLRVTEAMERPENWTISIQLVVFYLVSLAVFYGAHHGLKLFADSMASDLREGRLKALALSFLCALGLNFFGVAGFVMLGEAAHVPVRLAMVLVPMFLITEAYVKLLRADRENRYGYWAGLTGSFAGMASATYLLLRGAAVY